jgi:DNA-binding transcriptional MerR regulator
VDKSPDAFRTISEVADHLETPAHVLRFWESRFPQIRPVKRAGGRRYYRPSDVALLTGIKRLLHDEGLTIRGVQKILRDHGVRHVAGLSDDTTVLDEMMATPTGPQAAEEDLEGLEDLEDMEDVVYLDDHRDSPQPPPEPPEIIPEAQFIAIEDDEPDIAPVTPVQAVLPLFDTPAQKPVPVAPTLQRPARREDVTFASQIRALPPGHFAKARPELAVLARRLAALRSLMANRADGSGV